MSESEDRLDAIEQRLARLEERLAPQENQLDRSQGGRRSRLRKLRPRW